MQATVSVGISIVVLAILGWFLIGVLLGGGIVGAIYFAVQVTLCFLVGYGLVSFWRREARPLIAILATILGVEIATSIYALTRFYGSSRVHLVLISSAAGFGAFRLLQVYWQGKRPSERPAEALMERRALCCGIIVMLAVGSAYYFSGRLLDEGLVFYGPMARDHIFHLALLARLEYVIPPDNFVVSGYPPFSYHFFNEVAQDLFDRGFWSGASKLDIYYRSYPAMLLFAAGFLAFWVPANLYASRAAGAIGAAIILCGADFTWLLGMLQTLKALPHADVAREKLFEPWILWGAFSQLYPLVHRPAYYHGLLIFLAGLACIAGRSAKSDISWVLAGLIWGLMAGFNYTLAVTLGVAVVGGAAFYTFRRDPSRVRQLTLCAAGLLIGSIPANLFILRNLGDSITHSTISIVPSALAIEAYGNLFAFLRSDLLISFCSTVLMILVCYGVKLAGVWPMLKGTGYRFQSNSPSMTILASAFAISFVPAFLLKSDNVVEAILAQPTGWMLGLFVVYPLFVWMKQGRRPLRYGILTALLLIGPLQALPLFNLGYKAVITPDFLSALQRIKTEADPNDVIAFLPDALQTQPILGFAPTTNNFYVTAFTGLRAYYSTRGYTGRLAGVGPDDDRLYESRISTIRQFLTGAASSQDIDLLIKRGVRWIVLPEHIPFPSQDGLRVWLSGRDFTVLKLDPARDDR